MDSLRVIAKSGKLTLILNGVKLKVIRAEVPDGLLQFGGVYGGRGKGVDNAPRIKIESYKVTAGE